jgi:DNA-binding NarL/FixJ family response regulator
MIEILIADVHAIFRDALRKLLDSDHEITIVGEAHNGAQCIKKLGELRPHLQLPDLRRHDKNGLAVLEEVTFDALSTRVIDLTAAENDRVCAVRNRRANPSSGTFQEWYPKRHYFAPIWFREGFSPPSTNR